jgi:hypothetical protein
VNCSDVEEMLFYRNKEMRMKKEYKGLEKKMRQHFLDDIIIDVWIEVFLVFHQERTIHPYIPTFLL